MSKIRRNHFPQFKTKAAIEVLQDEKTSQYSGRGSLMIHHADEPSKKPC